jgi:hypothetical protein
MHHPADTDPFIVMAAAAEHVAAGRVAEAELEWWYDDSEGNGRRMTLWLRTDTRSERMARLVALPPTIPDTPEGLP